MSQLSRYLLSVFLNYSNSSVVLNRERVLLQENQIISALSGEVGNIVYNI